LPGFSYLLNWLSSVLLICLLSSLSSSSSPLSLLLQLQTDMKTQLVSHFMPGTTKYKYLSLASALLQRLATRNVSHVSWEPGTCFYIVDTLYNENIFAY
jgi:hypothetical protein